MDVTDNKKQLSSLSLHKFVNGSDITLYLVGSNGVILTLPTNVLYTGGLDIVSRFGNTWENEHVNIESITACKQGAYLVNYNKYVYTTMEMAVKLRHLKSTNASRLVDDVPFERATKYKTWYTLINNDADVEWNLYANGFIKLKSIRSNYKSSGLYVTIRIKTETDFVYDDAYYPIDIVISGKIPVLILFNTEQVRICNNLIDGTQIDEYIKLYNKCSINLNELYNVLNDIEHRINNNDFMSNYNNLTIPQQVSIIATVLKYGIPFIQKLLKL